MLSQLLWTTHKGRFVVERSLKELTCSAYLGVDGKHLKRSESELQETTISRRGGGYQRRKSLANEKGEKKDDAEKVA